MSSAIRDSHGWYYIITDTYREELSETQKQHNALNFYEYFKDKMTLAAIAGILGNIERESLLNPGQIEADSQYNGGWDEKRKGHGFIQWTGSKNGKNPLLDWLGKPEQSPYDTLEWYNGAFQCYRIECEGERKEGVSGDWLPSGDYHYSWKEFCKLENYEEATKAYLAQRERAGVAALSQRIEYAKNWYEFLQNITKDGLSVHINDTSAFDDKYEYGIHKGTVTKESREFKLTSHLTLGDFCADNSNEYAYSDSTVRLLETLILTYRDTINQKTPIKFTSSYRLSGSDMHRKGGAVDVAFIHNNGSYIDCRYIAVAAEKLGFTGIAPLHKNGDNNPADVIHLDTRGDFVAAGGDYSNTLWRGWEYPSSNPRWYNSITVSCSDRFALQKKYKITDADLSEVLGNAYSIMTDIEMPSTSSLPKIHNLVVSNIGEASAECSVDISGEALSAIYYVINETKVNLPIATGKLTFSIKDLIPNTKYAISVAAENVSGTELSPQKIFTTKQSYPMPIESVSVTATDKSSASAKFNIIIKDSNKKSYWQDHGYQSGYYIFVIKDYKLLYDYNDSIKNTKFDIVPATFGLANNDNFQIGVSTWVLDNNGKRIFAQPGQNYPVCSNSIFLSESTQPPNTLFMLLNNKISKVQPYLKQKTFMPLKIFKMK